DVSDVALRGGWPNKTLLRQLRNNLGYFVGVFRYSLADIASRAGEDAFDARWVANQDDRVARHTGLTPVIQVEESGVKRCWGASLENRQVGVRRNPVEV